MGIDAWVPNDPAKTCGDVFQCMDFMFEYGDCTLSDHEKFVKAERDDSIYYQGKSC